MNRVYPCKRKKMIVTGVCESVDGLNEISEILKRELTPRYPVCDNCKMIYQNICYENSICVSVRRGDFFSQENTKMFAVCDVNYFVDAKKIMDKKVENPHYFVFSDDIEWCKKNLPYENAVVTFVPSDIEMYEKIRIMYTCKHFIISNSTFSWWGQILSRNEDKIVISPSRWNTNGYESPLIDNIWILVDV